VPSVPPRPDRARRAAGASGRVPGAGTLATGLALAGALTAAFFVLASHVLGPAQAGRVDLVWSATWIVISVLYRPGEQLLSRTLADRRARGLERHPLRVPALVQAGFAAAFLVAALALRAPLRDRLFGGSEGLYRVFVIAGLVYALSAFARGWLAGHRRLGAYGALVVLEALTRVVVVLLVAVGIGHGQVAVAAGIAIAPLVSLAAMGPALLERRRPAGPEPPEPIAGAGSARFALGAAGIMLAEQTLLTAGVLVVGAGPGGAVLAGVLFNAMLIARAPLQLFQAVQTSLLPHLSSLLARGREAEADAVLGSLTRRIAAGTAALVLALLVAGPQVLRLVFGQDVHYDRIGLAAVGLGLGLHMVAGARTQGALARERTTGAATVWLLSAAGFLVWLVLPLVDARVLRAELGYALAAGALVAGLLALERAGVTAARASRPTARRPGRWPRPADGPRDG
jgi:O-antigen/teichoic acid export membrane protein